MTFKSTFHELFFVVTVVMGQFMMPFNLASTIIPGPVIVTDIHADFLQIPWLTASFSMGIGACLLVTGKLGDVFGPKSIYIIGMVLHSIFSLVTGFTEDIRQFTIFRGLTGAALALCLPTGVAMLANAFEAGSQKRATAFTYFMLNATMGFVAGAFATAIFGQFVVWNWTFRVMAMMTIIVAVTTWFVVPESINVHSGSARDVDYLGGVTGVISLLLITFGINQGASVGWHSVYVYVIFIVGFLSLFLFLFIEYKVKNPIMPLSIWRNPVVASVIGSATLTFVGWGIFLLYCTLFMQTRGVSMIMIAVQWIPALLSGAFSVFLSPSFMKVCGVHVVFPVAIGCISVGHLLLALMPLDQTYWAQLFIAIVVAIPGSILMPAGAQAVVSNSVSEFEQGIAGSLVNVVLSLPVAWGLSCASSLQQRVVKDGSVEDGLHSAAWLGFSLSAAAFIISLIINKKLKEANEKIFPPVEVKKSMSVEV